MPDIHRLLNGLTQAISEAGFPDATSLVKSLDLDISKASIIKTKRGNMCISGARTNKSALMIGIACGLVPSREIWLLLDDSSVAYQDVKDQIFGTDQRLVQSKLSAGFGVLFEIGGWTCGYTASSPDGRLETLFCEEPKPAPDLDREREAHVRLYDETADQREVRNSSRSV